MSEYLQTGQHTDKGGHPGKLVLNTCAEDPSLYELGTWRNRTETSPAQYITVDAKFLHELADYILTYVPEPNPLEGANLINAVYERSGLTYLFAKIEGTWYSQDGVEFSEKRLLEEFNITEVLR